MSSIPQTLLLVSAALLVGCPTADPDLTVPTPVADHATLDLAITPDADTIEEEEAFAEAMPAIRPSASDRLVTEGIPHHDPRFHDHYEEAVLLLEDGAAGEAVDALRMAVFDAPDSAPSWLLLGETYFRLGRSSQAFECVSEALLHDSDLAGARAFVARHHLDRGDPEAARPHAERYARLAPEAADAHFLVARTYMGLQMWEEAIDFSRQAISRDPQGIDAYNSLGFSALQIGRNELARQYLEAATELPGLQPWMLNNLGVAYERAGRDTDALQAFADAVAMDPAYSQARHNRDRIRRVVDRNVADEVARILAERAEGDRPDPTAEADRGLDLDVATP